MLRRSPQNRSFGAPVVSSQQHPTTSGWHCLLKHATVRLQAPMQASFSRPRPSELHSRGGFITSLTATITWSTIHGRASAPQRRVGMLGCTPLLVHFLQEDKALRPRSLERARAGTPSNHQRLVVLVNQAIVLHQSLSVRYAVQPRAARHCYTIQVPSDRHGILVVSNKPYISP